MNWPIGKVSDIADIISGYAFKSTWFDEGDDKIVRIGDLQNGRVVTEACKTINASNHRISEAYRIREGDILMALSGATVGKIAVADAEAEGAFLNQRVAIIRGKSRTNSAFLKYAFSGHLLDTLLLSAGGAAQPNLSPKKLAELEIPLPSLDEQKRIAAILDKADAIRQKRKQAIALADDFLRSVFLDMFGDPVTNPKGWEVKPLKMGISKITAGWSAKGENEPCTGKKLGVLKVSAVTGGTFKPFENKAVVEDLIPSGKALIFPKKGDLLFSRANTRELVGATCIVTKSYDNVFLPDKLWSISVDGESITTEYLHMLVQHPKFRSQLTSQATGTSGSMLNISKAKLEGTFAPFPDISVQLKFKEIYWKHISNIEKLEALQEGVEHGFSSLAQKVFSGQL
ncbi:TPA: restriction endonuclease subunit S [Photobacterium damselae]